MRFRRVPGQMADEVPKSSGADGCFGESRCRVDKVPEGSGADG